MKDFLCGFNFLGKFSKSDIIMKTRQVYQYLHINYITQLGEGKGKHFGYDLITSVMKVVFLALQSGVKFGLSFCYVIFE